MIQCPECRSMIPDDSAFCDQCGKELKWCPECGRPKRGAECPVCGSDLVPGRKWLAGASAAEGAGENTGANPVYDSAASRQGEVLPPSAVPHSLDPTADAVPPLSVPGVAAASGGTPPASALVGNGWRMTLQPGQFGRGGGIWPELGSCPYVSGLHGQISEGPGGCWNITDVGSTNGTFVDGIRLQSGVATPLKKGSKVRIATLDFIVE